LSAVAQRSEPVVIVGAGLSGLIAAEQVAASGQPTIVLEGSARVGGRLATVDVGEGRADLGAQFFTVRSEAFARRVEEWSAKGIVYEWCRGFNEVDGYPRYAVRGGMGALAVHLAGELPDGCCEVRTGHAVEVLAGVGGGRDRRWRLAGPGWELYAAAVLLTCPVPEALALLDGDVTSALDGDLRQGLRAIDYHRVLAVAALLDRPSAIPPPGARQLEEGPFSFVADNEAKGLSDRPTVTLHVAHTLSAQLWDERDDDALVADLLERARPWLGDAVVLDTRLERWLRSGPVVAWPDRCCEPVPGLFLAGDAFGGPKVEGAFLSGLEAGRRLAHLADGTSAGVGSDGTSAGVGSDGTSAGLGSDDTSAGLGSDGTP
jgi:renalase